MKISILKPRIFNSLFIVLFYILLVGTTHAQIKKYDEEAIFPNQTKLQALYKELGKKAGSKSKYLINRLSKYYNVVERKENKIFDITDKSNDGVRIVLMFEDRVCNFIMIEYADKDYLKLFGVPYEQEKDSVENIENLYFNRPFSKDNYTRFYSYSGLKIHRWSPTSDNSKWKVEFNFDKSQSDSNPDSKIYVLAPEPKTIPDLFLPKNQKLNWLFEQLGRYDMLEMKYEFFERIENSEAEFNYLYGVLNTDKKFKIMFHLDDKFEFWESMHIEVELEGTTPKYFNFNNSTWENEYEAAKNSNRFKDVNIVEGFHLFNVDDKLQITHGINNGREFIIFETKDRLNQKRGEFNKYAVGGDPNNIILFKGQKLKDGTPNGKILAKLYKIKDDNYRFQIELNVKNGKLINDRNKLYEINLSNKILYQGAINQDTWKLNGFAIYTFHQGEEQINLENSLGYQGYFYDLFEPNIDSNFVIRSYRKNAPFRGDIFLFKLEDLKIAWKLNFDGLAFLIPEGKKDERIQGYFNLVNKSNGSYTLPNFEKTFDSEIIPNGKHVLQKLINNKWQTVETTDYNIFLNGTIEGRDFYNNKFSTKYSFNRYNGFNLPNIYQFEDDVKNEIVNTTVNILTKMSKLKPIKSKKKIYLKKKDLFGFLKDVKIHEGFEPIYNFPDYSGIVRYYEYLKKNNVKWYQVNYIYRQQMSETQFKVYVNKIVSAVLLGAKRFWGDDLEFLKGVWNKKEKPYKHRAYPTQKWNADMDAPYNFQFSTKRKGSRQFIELYAYYENGIGQVVINFK